MTKFRIGAVVKRIGGTVGGMVQGDLYKVTSASGNGIKVVGLDGYYNATLFVEVSEEFYEKEKVVAALEVLLEYNRGRANEESVGLNRSTSAIYWNSPLPEYSLERFKEKFLETEEDRKKKELMKQMDKLKSEMSKLEEQMEKL